VRCFSGAQDKRKSFKVQTNVWKKNLSIYKPNAVML